MSGFCVVCVDVTPDFIFPFDVLESTLEYDGFMGKDLATRHETRGAMDVALFGRIDFRIAGRLNPKASNIPLKKRNHCKHDIGHGTFQRVLVSAFIFPESMLGRGIEVLK